MDVTLIRHFSNLFIARESSTSPLQINSLTIKLRMFSVDPLSTPVLFNDYVCREENKCRNRHISRALSSSSLVEVGCFTGQYAEYGNCVPSSSLECAYHLPSSSTAGEKKLGQASAFVYSFAPQVKYSKFCNEKTFQGTQGVHKGSSSSSSPAFRCTDSRMIMFS